MRIKNKTPVKQVQAAQSVSNAETVSPAVKESAPKKQRVTFSVRTEAGSEVFLAGDFNNWDPRALSMSDKKEAGVFTVTLSLPAGDHEYKFVIDGTWCVDPECADWVQNDHGTLNSIKRVG